ncbi:hypothetical protein DPMN_046225 [Dreissena polymorpha]|uniref:Uncharacterized protein n=1 Tax=Dreissena polymorpha TaxID=45954 RepID=A0A9D4I226_DREPO|nr:hypothetical protein DPMN_046225 [Dreissena polymorpha]
MSVAYILYEIRRTAWWRQDVVVSRRGGVKTWWRQDVMASRRGGVKTLLRQDVVTLKRSLVDHG